MRRLFTASVKPAVLLSTALAAGLLMPMSSEAYSVTAAQLQLFADNPRASVNGLQLKLDEPPAIIKDRFYVPVKWLADTLKFSLEWDSKDNVIRLAAPRAYIEFNAANNSVRVNGSVIPFDSVAEIRNGRLLVQLSWLSQYAGLSYRYDDVTRSVVLNYMGQPAAPYKESLLWKDDSQPNSKPAAVFAFGKSSYRLGEPVEYIDLSYDPDAEGLPDYEWTGKEEAFFEPGVYSVTLQVSDPHGNRSDPFTQTVTVLNEPFVSKSEFPFHFKPSGTLVEYTRLAGVQSAAESPIPVVVRQPGDKTLISGSSIKPVTQKGFLYQDSFIQGARLSIEYTNGLDKPVQFGVILRNENNEKAVKVTTVKQAEAQASIYTPLMTQKTAEQFLVSGTLDEEISIDPRAAVFYKVSPEVASGQGFHGIYDLLSDGKITASYVMMEPGEPLYNLGDYPASGQTETRNGTYSVSEVGWQVDARDMKAPVAIGLGDPAVEPPLKGTDAWTKQEAVQGLAGIRYRIQVEVNGKTTVMLHPRGGFFQGAVRVNGNIAAVPEAGLTSNDMLILHRTTPAEKTVDIEIMAVEGSRVPVELVLIPFLTEAE
ncbi:MAG: hypothetical protein K0S39_5335 [Paenibacillus sp.]|jgi:PKD repeat protein|nr:hypothetical protein [Paenibacillus sp.]